jgi:prepilin-type N-terminal cleavage/methylation domain-containing protein
VTARRPLRPGFTLLEVLAVVLLTAVVFTAAVNFYLELSRKSLHAADLTRDVRRASAILDRVARDLEGSVLLVKPKDEDPTQFPWLFLAETRNDRVGADRFKFTTRSHVPRTSERPESDLEVVAYVLRQDDEGTFELVRWSSPQLPDRLDRTFRSDPEDGGLVLARGIEQFGVRFLAENGEWKSTWDSSTELDSSKLPLAAEIGVRLADPDRVKEVDADPASPYTRRVLMPMRPIDFEAILKGDETQNQAKNDGKDDDKDAKDEDTGMTVGECLALNPGLQLPVDPSALASISGQSASSVAKSAGVQLPANCK